VTAGRRSDEADAQRIDAELRRAGAHPRDRRPQVSRLRQVRLGRAEVVVDGERRPAGAAREVARPDRPARLVAGAPAAAVDEEHGGDRRRRMRREERVEALASAVVDVAVLDDLHVGRGARRAEHDRQQRRDEDAEHQTHH
jgi:hypothetical protein